MDPSIEAWRALPALEQADEGYKAYILLLCLTCVRPGECRQLQFDWLNKATNSIDIPGRIMKIKHPEPYRARWQIELQFKCFKSFSNLKTDRIVTSSIIEAFLDLTRAAHAIKLLLGQAAQKLPGTALSQQKVAERCNGKLVEILDAMIRGTGDLVGIIRKFLADKALRLKKSSPSFINRKRGKSLLCVIRSMLGKCRTAAIHIPRLKSRPQAAPPGTA